MIKLQQKKEWNICQLLFFTAMDLGQDQQLGQQMNNCGVLWKAKAL
jgi:hypothetical protein